MVNGKNRVAALALLTCAAIFLVARPVQAVPTLQLDIAGGSYDVINEDIVGGGSPVTLAALLVEDGDTFVDSTFCLSFAIVKLDGYGSYGGIAESDAGWGTFSYAGAVEHYGIPPYPAEDLPKHGVFETRYFEVGLDFTTYDYLADSSYNSQTGDHVYPLPAGDEGMYVKLIEGVDVSGLASGYALHVDLYQKDSEGNVVEFAPFSHDATIPEPTSFVLTAAGIALFGLIRRRR